MTEQNNLAGGWQVWPGEVQHFRDAVTQVRAQLNTVFSQVDQLTGPDYQTQLGSSPVGGALAAKFGDRLSGGQGLLSYLNTALKNLDEFVSQAERTAAKYTEADQSAADGLRG